MPLTAIHRDGYSVGWICALALEMAAAKMMLDEIHPNLPQLPHDQNNYVLGRIAGHNVVIACLPAGVYGTTSATLVAEHMLLSFPSIRFGLLVGIGGGVPRPNIDIRLGDVVVSKPTDQLGGVVQFDLGKTIAEGSFQRTATLNKPPSILLTAISDLESNRLIDASRMPEILSRATIKPLFQPPGEDEDRLFEGAYGHEEPTASNCSGCQRDKIVARMPRPWSGPCVHYGIIASGNQVMKHGLTRDRLARELNILCFEMEAAGLMDHFPCLVIRGICDYADSHKNKQWQPYAAATAAAYARELLSVISVQETGTLGPAKQIMNRNRPFHVPFNITGVPATDRFIGREDYILRLWEVLQPDASSMQKVAILHGLGGIGKTQLAIQFARTNKNQFSAVFFVNGNDKNNLVQSLALIAKQVLGGQFGLDLEACIEVEDDVNEQAERLLKWLAMDGNSNWLLIYDNVDQYSSSPTKNSSSSYDIREFFPSTDHGSILITSRLSKTAELGTSFSVQKLPEYSAIELLQKCSGTEKNLEHATPAPGLRELALRLDGLPLAIVVAGSFIRCTGMSFEKYLRNYNDFWYELLAVAEPQRDYTNGSMLTTWTISYQEVLQRNASAAKLLLLLSSFHCEDVWYELLAKGTTSRDRRTWFADTVSNEIKFSTTIQHLVDFSLVQTSAQTNSYSMHPVIHDWCRYKLQQQADLSAEEMRRESQSLAIIAVGSMVALSSEKHYWVVQRRLLPHVDHLQKLPQFDEFELQDPAVAEAVHGFGKVYRDLGQLENAQRMYEQSLFLKEKTLGSDDPSTLRTINSLALAYRDQGRLELAETMYQRALSTKERVLGPEDVSTIDSLFGLGFLYQDEGKLEEAEAIQLRALAIREKTLGPDNPRTLDSLYGLGILYINQSRVELAEGMCKRAFAGYTKVLGPDHTHTLDSQYCLALLHHDLGEFSRSEEMFEQVIAGYEKALGAGHTSTLNGIRDIASLYRDQGRLEEAEEMQKRALAGFEKAVGIGHAATLESLQNLAILYQDQGRLKEAASAFHRAVSGMEADLGADNILTLRLVDNFALLCMELGDLTKAEHMCNRACEGFKAKLGSDNLRTSRAVLHLGNLHERRGMLVQADQIYCQVLRWFHQNLKPEHPLTLQALYDQATLRERQGRRTEARKIYKQVLNGRKAVLGVRHTDTLKTLMKIESLDKQIYNRQYLYIGALSCLALLFAYFLFV
ncbi:hypothetical protein EMCG_01008 [[Emmonsia] crescens]|uniref:DUF7779 domain-containing protein n=1 Tax=[Emmonsia] crescens TaxID=73230 RepID=A0A0G2IE43_9EURO|nr:hypothetical protein EMCG_01008 [Emmonsia crescens UAMH 3008]